LRKGAFSEYRVGLVHGRLPQAQQQQVMDAFKAGELEVMVATTVLEVGIDIPNATCMIVEHAQRFGLAQLHQLRGRVGRGPAAASCLLISDPATDEARQRIQAMVSYHDGFRIAEADLEIRGPGEFFGARQHGLSELKLANPLTQLQLLKCAREEALRVVKDDPGLTAPEHGMLRQRLQTQFPDYEKAMVVG
jgi:ATP-dependent DNA helicase RecG